MAYLANMFVISYRKYFYALSGIVILGSILAALFLGLHVGIDFKGGSLIEVVYTSERPAIDLVKNSLTDPAFAGYSIRPTGTNGFILRTPFLSTETHTKALAALSGNGQWPLTESRFDSIGPTIGKELKTKSTLAVGLVIFAIVIFIAFVFRKVSEPVSSWKYGLIAIVALLHDVIVPTGGAAILGYFIGMEIDALFVTAILVVLGFSVHDTIVVFDRVREHLRVNKEYGKREPFEETVGKSVAETFNRSINTSLTTVLALVALYFLGSESTHNFALTLIIGIIAGTYSSIFLASPLLVTIEKWQNKGAKK